MSAIQLYAPRQLYILPTPAFAAAGAIVLGAISFHLAYVMPAAIPAVVLLALLIATVTVFHNDRGPTTS